MAAERVEIIVTAKDSASQILRGVTSSFGAMGSMVQSLTSGRLMEQFATEIVNFGKDSVDATVKYANEVRALTLLSDESAESSSRFIQVLDDYKLTAGDAMLATKALTKEGLTPNIETLAMLSDEYLSLNDKQEQNEFILKKLGKGGLEWVEVLNKGSKAILEQGAAVKDGLILSDAQLVAARENELAMDALRETGETLSYSLGNKLIPVANDLIKMLTVNVLAVMGFGDALGKARDEAESTLNPLRKMTIVMQSLSDWAAEILISNMPKFMTDLGIGVRGVTDANEELIPSLEKTNEELKAEEDAVKALSKANDEYLKSAIGLTEAHREQDKTLEEITQTILDLEAEKERINPLETERIDEINGKIEEQKNKYTETKEEFRQMMEERFAMMAIEKIAMSDGIAGFSDAELQKAQAVLQTMDVVTAAALEEQLAMDKLTSAVASGRISVEEFGAIVDTAMADGVISIDEITAAINAIPEEKTITVTVETIGASTSAGGIGGGDSIWDSIGEFFGMAGGGGVSAGKMYRVNETRTEYFKPSVSGTILPMGGNGGGGASNTFVYSPTLSLASKSEVEQVILPFVINAMRNMQSNGLAS